MAIRFGKTRAGNFRGVYWHQPSMVRKLFHTHDTGKKIILAVFSSIILLAVCFIYNSYVSHLDESKARVLSKLEAIANTTAILIDGDQHDQLSHTYRQPNDIRQNADDSIYLRLHQVLMKSYHANHLSSPLYTLAYDATAKGFVCISTSAMEPHYRQPYRRFPKQLLDGFKRGTGGILKEYQGEKGSWLFAFAPIRNSAGKTVALVLADQDFDVFVGQARSELWRNVLASLYVFVFINLLLYGIIRVILKQETLFKETLLESNQEILSQNEEIEAQNNQLAKAQLIIEQQNENLTLLNGELNEKVQQRTSDLERANQDLTTFLYRSSHDIYGPLATLKGLCHLAVTEVKNRHAQEYFDKIFQTTLNLERFIKHINAVYEIKSKEPKLRSFDLKTLAQATIDKHRSFVRPDEDVHFTVHIADDFTITSDLGLIELVLSELIRNAIHYRHIAGADQHRVTITASHTPDNQVIISVSDNGMGISAQAQEKLFNMFHRGSEISQGAGLGLYIVKIALDRLNGYIELVQDHPTMFQISLPQPHFMPIPASVLQS
jgi:signal transduction histidine kinase